MRKVKPMRKWGLNAWQTILLFGVLQCSMTAYFNTLIVLVPMFLLGFFGVGALVYLPYALAGLYLEYYCEWVQARSLVSPFAVLGLCTFGVLTGLSADLAFFYAGGLETGPGTFPGLSCFGLPWLLASGAFGGYTAWSIAKDLT